MVSREKDIWLHGCKGEDDVLFSRMWRPLPFQVDGVYKGGSHVPFHKHFQLLNEAKVFSKNVFIYYKTHSIFFLSIRIKIMLKIYNDLLILFNQLN